MKATRLLILAVGALGFYTQAASAQTYSTDYFGQADRIPIDNKSKTPLNGLGGDVFGSELYIDGRTDVSLDLMSIQAEMVERQKKQKEENRDKSIRTDVTSGQPINLLIAPDHFTQVTFLRDGEIVYPKRAYPAQPELVIIEKKEDSPYLYIEASVMFEGQTTNLFIETEEDGRVQTYVLNLKVTTPNNIRDQVQVNLVNDLTPPIRGGKGSEEDRQVQAQSLFGLKPNAGRSSDDPALKIGTSGVHPKFTRDDIKHYFNTMIQMAENYGQAKQIEKDSGKIIYRDTDIVPYPGSKVTYVDPVEDTLWRVREIWFFPKYDAILLGVTCFNPTEKNSLWDYSLVKWKVNGKLPPFDTTAAAPISMQTPPKKTNVIWYLLQGYRLDPMAEYSPVYPKESRRGTPGESKNSPKMGDVGANAAGK